MEPLPTDRVPAWVREHLLDPARTRPVVAVTSHGGSGHYPVDPDALERALGGLAEVVAIETGAATWALSDALPARLDVYGGAVRVWWPGLGEDSDPFDHRLYLVRSRSQAEAVAAEVRTEVTRRTRALDQDPVPVVVESLEGGVLLRTEDGRRGPLLYADVAVAALAVCLADGVVLRARPVRERQDGSTEFSLEGILPRPWERIAAELEPGDVVRGRVARIDEGFALVELLPGARGLVPLGEADWGFVRDIGDVLEPGEITPVQVLSLDPDRGRAELSVKRAQTAGRAPRPLPSLVPEGRPFDWQALSEREASTAPDERSVAALRDEFEAVLEDRDSLRREAREARERARTRNAELRSLRDRYAALERRVAPDLDPLSSERAFLLAVRLAYARAFGEDDRLARPLQRMRVGRSFLESVRALEGIETQKVVEVCAQIACGAAHDLAGREVHQLREGAGGSRSRTRAADGAQAWRCALQVGTPSARRIHWWVVPGEGGATIEFANVALHDDVGVPE